jgi:hypothetical protein
MTVEQAPKEGRIRGGWTPVYRELWTHYLPVIGKDALIYYLYLLNYRQNDKSNPRHGKAWPGRNKVASDLKIAKKTLQKIDDILVAAGLVEIERIPTDKGRARIQYVVNDPLPAEEIDLEQLVSSVRNQTVSKETSTGFQGNLGGFHGNMINTYISIPNEQELKNNSNSAPDKSVAEYNSRDFIKYWCAKYKEVYKDPYIPNFGREGKLIKTKLLPAYGPERLVRIIDAAVTFYPEKWASPKYPRPTIGILASWLANEAAAFVDSSSPLPPQAQDVDSDEPAQILDYDEMKRRGLL